MPRKKAVLDFIADKDVSHCGILSAKTPSKLRKSKIIEENEVSSPKILRLDKIQHATQQIKSKPTKLQRTSSMKTIRESDLSDKSKSSKVRHSTYIIPSSERRRVSLRPTKVAEKTAETTESDYELRTPKKRRRVSKINGDSSDYDETEDTTESKVETSRRTSKRITAINEKATASSKLKRNGLRSNLKKAVKQSKTLRDESDSSVTDEGSSSDPEIPSDVPLSSYSTKKKSQKVESNSSVSSSNTKLKSNSNSLSIVPSTPKSKRVTDPKLLRTPAAIRKKLSQQLAAISRKIESDEESSGVSELDHSSDDFVPSSSECESIDDGESSGSSDSDDSTKPTPIQERISKLHKDGLGRKKPVEVDFPYKIDADGYFLSKCTKEPTSNNQLSSLEVCHLEEDEIKNVLRDEYTKHGTDLDKMIGRYAREFIKWSFYLKENFNLLMYGLGSKMELLEHFHSEILSCHDVLTIHGYFPRLLVKDILNSLITDILKINAPKSASEALPVIKSTLKSRKSPVFIIIHNVDRLICRQRKQLSTLSKLASLPNLHMIVSIDHINAPLLWGNSMLTELNFIWMNIPTYQPYVNETSFENLIYLNEAGTNFVSLSSLRNIFKPLAPRIKKLFQIIAKERLENANNRQYKGMSYEEWYHRARAEHQVNNITVFKVQLTELIDHGIIKMNDQQCIPILVKLDVLEKFYKEMYGAEEE